MNPIQRFNACLFILFLSLCVAQAQPANNDYTNATALTVQAQSCSSQTQGDLTDATNSNNLLYSSSCAYIIDGTVYVDVWYKATVPSSGNLNIQTSEVSGSPLTNTMLFAYTLTDNVLAEIGCNHDDSAIDSFATVRLTGLAENTEVYIMVVDEDQATGYDSGSDLGTFYISAYDPDLSPPTNNDPEDAIELTVYETDSCTAEQITTGTWANSTHSGYAYDSNFCGSWGYATTPDDIWYKLTVPQSDSLTVAANVDTLNEDGIFFVFYTLNEGVFTKFYCEQSKLEVTISDRTAGEEIYVQLMSAGQIWGYDDSLHPSLITICAYDDSSLTSTPTTKPMLSYYSNPMGNRLRLESPYKIQSLAIHDLVGREVLTKSPQEQNLWLNTYSLSSGVYLLKVQTAEGEQTVKLIKK